MNYWQSCPKCGQPVVQFRNPFPTVDIIIHIPEQGVVLVQRKNLPYGWALPGGFVDYGESVEQAALREAKEETGLEVQLIKLLGIYSRPDRDPRKHTMSTVFTAKALNADSLKAGDDAGLARIFPIGKWPELAFDHQEILSDYIGQLQGEKFTEAVRSGRTICSG